MVYQPATSRIRICDPGELIEAVPYLLGFHPRESVTFLGMSRQESPSDVYNVAVTARIDLPASPPSPVDLAPIVDILLRAGARLAVVLVHRDDDGDFEDYVPMLLRAAQQALLDRGVLLADLLVIGDRTWTSALCTSEDCCPQAGRERLLDTSVVAASAVLAGMVARTDRDELAAVLNLAPPTVRRSVACQLEAAQKRIHDAAVRVDSRAALLARDRNALLASLREPQAGPMSARRVARFGVALQEIEIRDACWEAIEGGALDPEPALLELLRGLPPPFDAAPLFLFGWARWRGGDGTMAAMAAERALASDPRCSAAKLLAKAVANGVNPRSLPRLCS
jgi:Domain of unknown function (DUF4192)